MTYFTACGIQPISDFIIVHSHFIAHIYGDLDDLAVGRLLMRVYFALPEGP